MNDLIDLGNLVFDELKKKHGEEDFSRELFLYCLTQSQTFYLAGSNKVVTISKTGVSKNFDDSVIDSLDAQWKSKIEAANSTRAEAVIQHIKNPGKQPKDGDVFNFWENDNGSEWREIKF